MQWTRIRFRNIRNELGCRVGWALDCDIDYVIERVLTLDKQDEYFELYREGTLIQPFAELSEAKQWGKQLAQTELAERNITPRRAAS
jgi:hypothetical protein